MLHDAELSHHPFLRPPLGALPPDEAIDREARELSERFSPKEYAEAMKTAVKIGDLQKASLEEIHKMADKEGVLEAHKLPRHELIFEILKGHARQSGVVDHLADNDAVGAKSQAWCMGRSSS